MTRASPGPTVAAMTSTPTRPRFVRLTGVACLVGAAMMTILATATQVVQASTDVPKDQWSYPWSSGTSITFSLVAAGSQLLLVVGVLGLRRSGVAGTTRTAGLALWAALAGTALIVIGHLASIPIRDDLVDEGWPHVVEAVFGLGTVLFAIGFLVVGRATIRAGIWRGWRRFTPLAIGVWSVVLIGLQLTPALPTAVAVYALSFLALGVALSTQPTPEPDDRAALAVQEQMA